MDEQEIKAVRNRRLYATRAAAHISMMSRKTGECADSVPWQVLSNLPSWCLADQQDRQSLQRVCGAFYLSPLIHTSINGSVLRTLKTFLGHQVFDLVRSDRFDHEADGFLRDTNLESQVMACGSSVLLETLDDKNLVRLYAAIIGSPATIDVDKDLDIYGLASEYTDSGQLPEEIQRHSVKDVE